MLDVNSLISQVMNNAVLCGVAMTREQAIAHLAVHAKHLIRELPHGTKEDDIVSALNVEVEALLKAVP